MKSTHQAQQDKPRVAAIVPAYNEERTIANVIKELVSSALIDEVIVISDGSSDGTAAAARAAGATLVHQLPMKSGKGKAVQHGIAHTDASILFFCDADLLSFRAHHAEAVIRPVLEGKLSMCVGLRDRGKLLMRLAAHLPLIGGERAMQRKIFEQIPEQYVQGFKVEAALNYACRSRNLPYGSVPLWGLRIRRKMQKVGFWKGLQEYVHMFWEVGWAMISVRVAHLQGKFLT